MILGSYDYVRAEIIQKSLHDNVVVKGASDPHDPNPVEAEHVLSVLRQNFPEHALGWVKKAHWVGPIEVDPKNINFHNKDTWAAAHQGKRVKQFADAIKRNQSHLHPVILVKTYNNNKYSIVDGHHRTLAYVKLKRPVWAYIGYVPSGVHDWEETHSYQFHAGTDPLNQ